MFEFSYILCCYENPDQILIQNVPSRNITKDDIDQDIHISSKDHELNVTESPK
jgi:hypothetical protein